MTDHHRSPTPDLLIHCPRRQDHSLVSSMDVSFRQLTAQLEDNFERNRQTDDMRRQKLLLRRHLQDILNPYYCEYIIKVNLSLSNTPPRLTTVVDLFVVGSSVNDLAYFESDADICLLFTDRPDRMDQSGLAVLLLNKVKQLLSRDREFPSRSHRTNCNCLLNSSFLSDWIDWRKSPPLEVPWFPQQYQRRLECPQHRWDQKHSSP